MPEPLDEQDAALAEVLAAYDELVDRAQRLGELARDHAEEAREDGDPKWVPRAERSLRSAEALVELLDGPALDVLMDLKQRQHQARLARQRKLV